MLTPNQQEVDFVWAAADLARRNPESWKRLVDASNALAAATTNACITSPTENLQVAQGRAQAMLRLHALLAGCVEMAENMEKKNA